MAQQTINVGTAPNDGTGTPLRTAFQYTNSNFSELYTAVGPSGNNIVVPGNATITGDLTVRTNKLFVNATGVGVGTTNVLSDFTIQNGSNCRFEVTSSAGGTAIENLNNARNAYLNMTMYADAYIWNRLGSTAMTLNSTGLGVGVTPTVGFDLQQTSSMARITSTSTTGYSSLKLRNTGASGRDYEITVGGSGTGATAAGNLYIYDNTAAAVRFLLDSSGNLGIGVTPSAGGSGFYKTLELGKAGCGLFVGTASLSGSEFTYLSGNGVLYYNAGNTWKYGNNGPAAIYGIEDGVHKWYNATTGTAGVDFTPTQAMTLDASGNLLVGTTTNTDNFRTNIQFSGTSTNGLLVKNLASSGAPLLFQLIDSAQSLNTASPSAEYQDSTTQRWRLYKNGGLANYQANNVNLSDVRTKTDIKPLGSYWNKIKSLEVVTFKYKDQTHSDDNIGLIAQQVESVAPELVDADGFGNTPEDGVPLKTIYTTDLYHAAIKALQEAMTRIEALEAKLA